MVLHLGEDLAIPVDQILMIINATNMTPELAAWTEGFKKNRRYVACQGKPKAFALVRERGKTRDRLYASSIAAATLQKRLNDTISRKWLFEAAVLSVEEI